MIRVQAEENLRADEYPKLMIYEHDEMLILATQTVSDALLAGLVVREGDYGYLLGQYRTDWCLNSFTEFHGKVTIENV